MDTKGQLPCRRKICPRLKPYMILSGGRRFFWGNALRWGKGRIQKGVRGKPDDGGKGLAAMKPMGVSILTESS